MDKLVSNPLRRTNKYWAIFKTQVANQFTYPADIFSRSVMIVLFIWIFAQLWRTTYGASGSNEISGLSLNDTIWYLLIAETIILSQPSVAVPISSAVKDGSIAYLLSKPYNFLLYQLSIGLGDSLLLLITNALTGGIIAWVMVGPPPNIKGLPLTIIVILLATLINFCFNALIGLLAFITEEVNAFQWIYSKFILVLGGVLIPLDFFPDWLQKISKLLPFAQITYGPARFFIDPELPRFINLIAFQSIWLLLLTIILVLVYKKGTSWLAINGG
jgi:ABC-2 type transport system permease protein